MAHIFRRSATEYLIRYGRHLDLEEIRPTISNALIFAVSTGEPVTISVAAADSIEAELGTNSVWMFGFGGDIRVYRNLILRTGNYLLEIFNMDGELIIRRDTYTYNDYTAFGNNDNLHKKVEELADNYLSGVLLLNDKWSCPLVSSGSLQTKQV